MQGNSKAKKLYLIDEKMKQMWTTSLTKRLKILASQYVETVRLTEALGLCLFVFRYLSPLSLSLSLLLIEQAML